MKLVQYGLQDAPNNQSLHKINRPFWLPHQLIQIEQQYYGLWGEHVLCNWKHQLPSGLPWSFSLREESTYKSACSCCYHGDHFAKWISWKMLIIRLYVVLKAWEVKHMFISQIWYHWGLSYVPNVWPDVLYLFIKQKVCYTGISCLWILAYICFNRIF